MQKTRRPSTAVYVLCISRRNEDVFYPSNLRIKHNIAHMLCLE